MVIEYLPLESRACLATSSRTMARKLGTQYWRELRLEYNRSSGILRHYLQLVLRDRPSMYYCYNCIQLCSLEDRDHRCSAPGNAAELLDLGYAKCYHVSFQELQLAMARHRYYGSGQTLFKRLHYTRGRPEYSIRPTMVSEPEARCISGHLLFRTQNLIPFDLSSPRGTRFAFFLLVSTFGYHIARHWWSSWTPHWSEKVKLIFECVNDHSLPGDCEICDFRSLCPDCPTEISLQKVQTGSKKYMAIVTTWKDLGIVATPEDPIWQAHLQHRQFWLPGSQELNDRKWTNPQWQLANTRQRFETQPGATVADLTQDNLRKWNSLPGRVERFLYEPSSAF